MSRLTTVVLMMHCGECRSADDEPSYMVEAINDWLAGRSLGRIEFVEQHLGGPKSAILDVAGGTFNFLPDQEFTDFVMSMNWKYPSFVVLAMMTENGEKTLVFRPGVRMRTW